MKKAYVKPVASTVQFAMNENIAGSVNTGHLGFINHEGISDGTCNKYLAYYTDYPLDFTQDQVDSFKDLTQELLYIGFKYPELAGIVKEDIWPSDGSASTFNCWMK